MPDKAIFALELMRCWKPVAYWLWLTGIRGMTANLPNFLGETCHAANRTMVSSCVCHRRLFRAFGSNVGFAEGGVVTAARNKHFLLARFIWKD